MKKAEALKLMGSIVVLVTVVFAANEAYRHMRLFLDQVDATSKEVKRLTQFVEAIRVQIDSQPGPQVVNGGSLAPRDFDYAPFPGPMRSVSLPLPSEVKNSAKFSDRAVEKVDLVSSAMTSVGAGAGADDDKVVLTSDPKVASSGPVMNVKLFTEKK